MADDASPRPWHLGTDGNVYEGEMGHNLIAVVDHGRNDRAPSVKPANGRLIVAAVNAHDDLLAACRAALEEITVLVPGRAADPISRRLEAVIARAEGIEVSL